MRGAFHFARPGRRARVDEECSTVELRDGVLRVTAKDPRWTRELERASATILARLQVMLGNELHELRVNSR